MSDAESIKVLIVNEQGQYLSGTATRWGFTEERNQAKVFDYLEDHVAEQIQMVKKAYGEVWIAVRLDPREAYEFCDRCGTRMTALSAQFDGQQFLCPECLRRAADPQVQQREGI